MIYTFLPIAMFVTAFGLIFGHPVEQIIKNAIAYWLLAYSIITITLAITALRDANK